MVMNTTKHTLTINLDDNYDLGFVMHSLIEEDDGRAYYLLTEAITNGDVEITIADGKVTTHCGAFNDDDDKKFAAAIAYALTDVNVGED